MNDVPIPRRRLWWLGAGFALWCSALVVLYGLHAIGCRFGWQTGALRLTLAVLLLVHVVAIAWLWRHFVSDMVGGQQGKGGFLHVVVVGTLIAALVSSLITFAPPLLLSTCL